jgi:epoxyqueuosine reductase
VTLIKLALTQAVRARALEAGFDAVGVGPATAPLHAAAFDRWLEAGYAGTMQYLARTRAERADPARLLPGVRSVVAVALNYNPGPDTTRLRAPARGSDLPGEVSEGAAPPPVENPKGAAEAPADENYNPGPQRDAARLRAPASPAQSIPVRGEVSEGAVEAPSDKSDWATVARYARGRDYHDLMRPRLRVLADFIDRATGPGTRSRAAVDTSAVLERDLAARAGLGWIGKNTNLLAPEAGSYFFIGIVLTTADLEPDTEQPDRCGTCTACLDACPTRAFVAPYVLDARRCLSYLTIEHRDDIAPDLAPDVRDWVFGCDVCQEVCPWNRRAPATREPALTPADRLGPLTSLLDLDDAAFRTRFGNSAISRAKRRGLVRNVALVLGNRRDASAAPALRRLAGDSDPVVQRAARWALARLERG